MGNEPIEGLDIAGANRQIPENAVQRIGDSQTLGPAVSIIVPCCGQLEFTRRCVPSVLRHTRPPYELVFVDMASLDGTADYLAGVEAAAHVPVKTLRMDRDVDFAVAYNAGIAAARGEFIVLLNNDVVVTDRWVEHFVALGGHDPQIGMVGPMSNHASPPQWTGPVSYDAGREGGSETSLEAGIEERPTPIDGIDRFARQWRTAHKGQWSEEEQLAGFCVLVRREALQQAGAYVMPSPLGYSEEDLCRRIRQAGYRLACCRDLFVHHYGTRSIARTPGNHTRA